MSKYPTEGAPPSWFLGTVMQAVFETEQDVNPLLPVGLKADDAHRAFMKVYQLKHGPLRGEPHRPAKAQYLQVCITTMAAPKGQEPRHYNLMMWGSNYGETHPGQPGWNKERARIDISWIVPGEERFAPGGIPYMVDVSVGEVAAVIFDGVLDHVKRVDLPPLNGFYVKGYDPSEILYLPISEATLGIPAYGSGTLSFAGRSPGAAAAGWDPGALGSVNCLGFGVQSVQFLRDYDALQQT